MSHQDDEPGTDALSRMSTCRARAEKGRWPFEAAVPERTLHRGCQRFGIVGQVGAMSRQGKRLRYERFIATECTGGGSR
jgi:hypothetical protein